MIKQQEEKRCETCDCFITEEGCECRLVPCSRCGDCYELFNMTHDEFHTDYWFENMSFHHKLSEILCHNCNNREIYEEEKECDDY